MSKKLSTLFWYSLIFWYKGTKVLIVFIFIDFGTLSSFGIKELYGSTANTVPHFGTLSSFGIKELVSRHTLLSPDFGTLSSFGIKERRWYTDY